MACSFGCTHPDSIFDIGKTCPKCGTPVGPDQIENTTTVSVKSIPYTAPIRIYVEICGKVYDGETGAEVDAAAFHFI